MCLELCMYIALSAGINEQFPNPEDATMRMGKYQFLVDNSLHPIADSPPLGRVQIGVEKNGWFVEAEHISSIPSTADTGMDILWAGKRWVIGK